MVEEEEFVNRAVNKKSLSLRELRDIREDFSQNPGEYAAIQLFLCWDNRASSLKWEGKEAKELGSLSREEGIDNRIGKGEQILSL